MKDPLQKYNRLHLYSPHYDDVFLSLGGYIGLNTLFSKMIHSIVVFSASTNVFGKKHPINCCKWASKIRRNEELTNLKKIGGTLSIWDYREAYLRGYNKEQWPNYPSAINIDFDSNTIDCISSRIEKNMTKHKNDLHVFPLSVGNHVDHLILRHCISNINNDGNVVFYEDLPYAFDSDILNKTTTMNSLILPVDIMIKKEFIWTYRSQNIAKWESKILNHMASFSNEYSLYGERIWFSKLSI